MNNVKGEEGNWSHVVKSYEFTKEDIEQVKQYVKDNGMGNSIRNTGCHVFYIKRNNSCNKREMLN
jgi:hypothetical protein